MLDQPWISLAVSIVVIAGLVYKFMFSGQVTESIDDRQIIQLSPAEQTLVRTEMRAFLESVQQITLGGKRK